MSLTLKLAKYVACKPSVQNVYAINLDYVSPKCLICLKVLSDMCGYGTEDYVMPVCYS